MDATVQLCLCRRAADVFRWLLLEQSLIVIGGAAARWWPSRAEQMARWLRKAGHQVVFASF